jgi:hypothetical protein
LDVFDKVDPCGINPFHSSQNSDVNGRNQFFTEEYSFVLDPENRIVGYSFADLVKGERSRIPYKKGTETAEYNTIEHSVADNRISQKLQLTLRAIRN